MGSLVKKLRYTGTRAVAVAVTVAIAIAATASAAPWLLLRRLAAASQSSFQTRNFPLSSK